MMYKFKSEEALNQFVSDTPYTDHHNIIFASIVGLDQFKTHEDQAYSHLGGIWASKGGQIFYITSEEVKLLEKVEV